MEFLIILLLLVLNGIFAMYEIALDHPAKHVSKLSPEKATNLHVEY